MKIGVCSKDFKGDLGEDLNWISEQNFSGLQVWLQQVQQSSLNPISFKEKVQQLDLKVSSVGGGPNLVDPHEVKNSIAEFKMFLEWSVELGCRTVCAETKMLPQHLTRDEGWTICVDTVGEICSHAEKLGAVLGIECAGPCFIRHHRDWLELASKVDSPSLKVNFDAANMAWARVDPHEALKALIDHVVHVHLKDLKFLPQINQMENEEDQDCILGEGVIDYMPLLQTLKDHAFDGFACIEMHCGEQDRKNDIVASQKAVAKMLKKLS